MAPSSKRRPSDATPGKLGVATPTEKMYWSRTLAFVAVGMTIGTMLDFMHTAGGAISYPPGTTHSRAFLTFGLAYSAGAVFYVVLSHRALKMVIDPPAYRHTLPLFFAFCGLYAATAYYKGPSWHLAAALSAFTVTVWAATDGSHQGAIAAAGVAIVGATYEAMLCRAGLMTYTAGFEFFMIPSWLLPLYCASAVTWGLIVRRALLIRHHGADSVRADGVPVYRYRRY